MPHVIATCLFEMTILTVMLLPIAKVETKQEAGYDLSVCVLNVLPSHHPPKFSGHRSCKSGHSFSNLSRDLIIHMTKDSVTIRVRASHVK